MICTSLFRQPRCRNLGVAVALIIDAAERAEERAAGIADDLRAFHAPSECYRAAFAGCERPVIEAIQQAATLAGLTPSELEEEIKMRTGGRWWGWTSFNSMIPPSFDHVPSNPVKR